MGQHDTDAPRPEVGRDYRSVFQHSNDAIFVIDPEQDRILDANPRAAALLGYSQEELRSLKISDVHPEEMPQMQVFVESVFTEGQGWTDLLTCLTKAGVRLPAEISASVIGVDGQRHILALVRDVSERKRGEELLRRIVKGTATVTGASFFTSLVKQLTIVLGVRQSFLAEYLPETASARTLAIWNAGNLQENFVYPLAGTPCRNVVNGELCFHADGVQELFPEDEELVRLQAKSYLGVPLLTPEGETLGHLSVIDDKPMEESPRNLQVLKIFAARARAELARLRAEAHLQASKQRLAKIIESASDAIVTVDAELQVTLFNAAAERAFGCPRAEAVGGSFSRFLSPGFRALLERRVRALGQPDDQATDDIQELTALRADGEDFPIEATVSPVRIEQQQFLTVILRDLSSKRHLDRLDRENFYLQEEIRRESGYEGIIGQSAALLKALERARVVAKTDSAVLISGETGTGKELVARTIHEQSSRCERPLIKVNCAALPAGLVESEFFGHEKGAFTGAISKTVGRFELADKGTIFLDEVGDTSLEVQAKLLRVLQEQEFERVGGTQTIHVDVRIIAATNRDLPKMIEEKTFRADLYYRLNVVPIPIPPLRERAEDTRLLVHFFVQRFTTRMGKRLAVDERILRELVAYPWPGNVRELQNVIERAVILSPGPNLEIEFDPRLAGEAVGDQTLASLEEIENAHIVRVLEARNWVLDGDQGAAKVLGMNPSTLRSRLKKKGIMRPKP